MTIWILKTECECPGPLKTLPNVLSIVMSDRTFYLGLLSHTCASLRLGQGDIDRESRETCCTLFL